MTDVPVNAGAPVKRRRTKPSQGHGPLAAAAVHRRRHSRHRDLCADGPGRQAGRRRGVAAFRGRLRGRAHDRVQLSRAGHEISEGGGRRPLHPQGFRHPFHHVHRCVCGDVLGDHLGIDGFAGVRREHVARDGARSDGLRHHRHGPCFHGRRCRGQFPRRRRKREGQCGAHLRRADGTADHHRHRPLGHRPRPGRCFARDAVSFDPGRRHVLAGDRGDHARLLAMVGFEDSVNMAEECKDPTRHFPKVLLAGLAITGVIYVLVSISAITLVAPEQLGEGADTASAGGSKRRARISRSGSSASSPCSPWPTARSSTC